jgi:phage major head subunit gpT-like protein
MCARKADGGNPLGIKPNLLVVPTNLRTAADEVVKVDRLTNGASNANQGLVEVLVTPWLNS